MMIANTTIGATITIASGHVKVIYESFPGSLGLFAFFFRSVIR
jgi:hypothetical protein